MFTEFFIKALLVDEELANLAWESWDAGLISDDGATWSWLLNATSFEKRPCRRDQILWTCLCPMSPVREYLGPEP